MKVGLISDLHFGAKKSDDLFFESQVKFVKDVFLRTLKEKEVRDIFILGDVFHDRRSISVKVLDSVSKLFRDDFSEFNVRVIVGNHDMYYSTNTDVNSVNYLSYISKNIKVYSKVAEDGKFLVLPWFDDWNKAEFERMLSEGFGGMKYALGHLEIQDFGVPDGGEGSISLSQLYPNFERVFSGHIHTP